MSAKHVDEALGGAHQPCPVSQVSGPFPKPTTHRGYPSVTTPQPRFTPLENYVTIRRDPIEAKTVRGIILPDPDARPPVTGVVVHVGPGKWHTHGALVPVNVRPGQKVRYGEWVAGQPLEDIDGEKLLLIRETDIVGKWA